MVLGQGHLSVAVGDRGESQAGFLAVRITDLKKDDLYQLVGSISSVADCTESNLN